MQTFCLRFLFLLLLLGLIAVNDALLGCSGKKKKVSPQRELSDYSLYTNKDPKNPIPSSACEKFSQAFTNGAKTFLIIHGWTGNPQDGWVINMKNALLQKENNANVIAVGWKKAAEGKFKYNRAAANTRPVGEEVAKFLKFLYDQNNVNSPDKFHVIGFSLGAQVSGFAGKSFKQISNMKIGRITGLDPAARKFEGKDADLRLAETDADFVDVIHTDIRSGVIHCGTRSKSGKFDFFPNGGKRQPGCGINSVKCSHYRAHQYFTESINSTECLFSSYRSNSWNDFKGGKFVGCGDNGQKCPEMGYNSIKYKDLVDGNFYLKTNSKAPYCLKQNDLILKRKHLSERPKAERRVESGDHEE